MTARRDDDEIVPRYEFRTFDRDLSSVADRIRRRAHYDTIRKSSETYLVAAGNVACNVKIRAGRLEMKSLLDTLGPLELWKPRFSFEFPVAAEKLTYRVIAALGCDPPPLQAGTMINERMLVREILPACPDIRLATVRKQRYLFEIESCRVEYGELFIDELPMQTAAIEHERPEDVLQVREMLGLATTENTSYQRKLQQVLEQPPVS